MRILPGLTGRLAVLLERVWRMDFVFDSFSFGWKVIPFSSFDFFSIRCRFSRRLDSKYFSLSSNYSLTSGVYFGSEFSLSVSCCSFYCWIWIALL